MSILAAMKKKKPELGFCPDFFEHLAPVGPKIAEKKIKVVVNGAGASAQACTELFINSGVKSKNIIMLDRKGDHVKTKD